MIFLIGDGVLWEDPGPRGNLLMEVAVEQVKRVISIAQSKELQLKDQRLPGDRVAMTFG